MNNTTATLQSRLRRNSHDLDTLDAQILNLLNERTEICYDLALARGNPNATTFVPPKPTKTQTCSSWALSPSGCPKTASQCLYAHHYFPVISWRAHHGGEQLGECKHYPKCTWNGEVCGFAHGREGKREREEMREYGRNLPWKVVMVMQCKRCGKPVDSIEEAEAHVEMGECFAMKAGDEMEMQGVEESGGMRGGAEEGDAGLPAARVVDPGDVEEGEIEG